MRILVSNLDPRVTEHSLYALFATYGTVADTKVEAGAPAAVPVHSAIVEMPNGLQARQAIARLHGSIIGGRAVSVMGSGPDEQALRTHESRMKA